MPTKYTDTPPELKGAIRCILRDIGRSSRHPLGDLPGKFDTRETAAILGLTTPRTLDTWASRPDCGGLEFVKVGRSRRYLLSDVVTFIAKRRTSSRNYSAAMISATVCEQIERLGMPPVEVAP